MKYESCCNDCAKKRYKIIRGAMGITIHKDVCKFCGESKTIIPGSDWAWMCGATNILD